MQQILTLLKPRFWSFRNPGRKKRQSLRLYTMAVVGILVWGGIFTVSFRVLLYFQSIQELGDLLAYKLLSMVFLTLFSLLVFSSTITCLSKLYLSKDLSLVHSLPVSSYKIFFSRWIESTMDSSWMVIVYTMPVFISYALVYTAGAGYYVTLLLTLPALSIIASSISALLVMAVVVLIPANRLRSIFIFLGLSLFLILYIAFRLLRPERLADPEMFATALIYLKALRTPGSPFLPSTWAYDALKAALAGVYTSAGFHVALSWSFAVFMCFVNLLFANAVYFCGMSKAQTATVRMIRPYRNRNTLAPFLSGPIRALVIKEIKTFFRDQTQWSQVFLLAALFFIYIYNFKVLPIEKAPIETIYLQNVLSFLNMGLAAFVLTAVTARFAYPAVSMEGDAFWLVKTAPISTRAFLWAKFFIYFIPLLLLSQIVIIITNILLQVKPLMMMISSLTMLFMVPGVVSLGIGMGAAYPDFKSENPAQTVTGFGGLLFMMLCAWFIGMVIIFEAHPVYHLFMADLHQRHLTGIELVFIIATFATVLLICILAVVLPMRFGEKRLCQLQI